MTRGTLVISGALLGVALLGGTTLAADEAAGAPPAEAQRLKAFAGEWKVSGEMTMGNQTGKFTGDAKCQEAASGFAVTCSMKLKGVPNMKEYTEVGIFAYDPDSKTVHYFSSANTGDAHDHVGSWTDRTTLQLQTSAIVDGKPAQEQLRIIEKGPKEIDVTNPVVSGGHQVSLTRFTLKK